jgi:hypothetical protein
MLTALAVVTATIVGTMVHYARVAIIVAGFVLTLVAATVA